MHPVDQASCEPLDVHAVRSAVHSSLCVRCHSECAAALQRFVEGRAAPGWGACSHAAAAVMRAVLGDLRLLTAQLQHRFLTDRPSLQAWPHLPFSLPHLAFLPLSLLPLTQMFVMHPYWLWILGV